MPLDELIQSWATFAHATTSPTGLSAVSAAFAALAAETTARHVAVFAGRLGASRLPDSVYVDLDEACDHWLLALGHLGHLSREGQESDETAPLLAELGRLSVQHQQSLFALSARLWQEQAPLPIQGYRRRLTHGPLSLPERPGPAAPAAPAGEEEEAQPC
jgi:hypothetical protein